MSTQRPPRDGKELVARIKDEGLVAEYTGRSGHLRVSRPDGTWLASVSTNAKNPHCTMNDWKRIERKLRQEEGTRWIR